MYGNVITVQIQIPEDNEGLLQLRSILKLITTLVDETEARLKKEQEENEQAFKNRKTRIIIGNKSKLPKKTKIEPVAEPITPVPELNI